jgi:phage terminase large subunit
MVSTEPVQVHLTTTAARTMQALNDGWPIIVNEGGARSGKSYGTIQVLISIAVTQPRKRISIVSHSLPHIKRGAYRDFVEIMNDWHLWDDEQFSYTEFVYTFPNGSYIELFGLEDPGKARGPGRDILFINEANLLSKLIFDQLAMRTTGQIILDLNPADFDSWCYAVADDPKHKKIHSTYKDNLQNLSGTQVRYIEAYQDADPYMWEVFGLGLRGKSTETIYTHWKICKELPMKGELFCGQDFGYVVPSALVRVEHYEGAIYVDELLYEPKLTTNDIIGRYQQLNISKTIEIFCDAAEPKTIEEIARAGYNAKPADKDVWAGIQKLKSMPLYITENSLNLLKEIKNYKWKVDKDGVVKPEEEPVKINDHACDSLRYAVFSKLSVDQLTWTAF